MEENKPFSREYEIKWHDTDANLVCRPSAMLMYMQETANLQCRAYGYDLDALRENEKLAFILSNISINFYSPIHARDIIRVDTWCPDSSGVSSLRSFRVFRGDEVVAEANSVWALLNIETRKFMRGCDFQTTHDAPGGEPVNQLLLLPRPHIKADDGLVSVGFKNVVFSETDYNGHMNNTHYPDMICDFLPGMKGMRVASLSIAFRGEAALGDRLEVFRAGGNGFYAVQTKRPDGSVNIDANVVVTEI